MALGVELLAAAFLAALIYYFFFSSDGKRYPKGPAGIPILGNLLQLKDGSHRKFCEWAGEYGGLYQIKMGQSRSYVISDLELLRKVLNDINFNARPRIEMFEIISGGPHGIVASSGEEWVEQRRFTLRHLRDFGFGKNATQELIMREVNEFLSKIEVGKAISIKTNMNLAVLNTLWMITTGNRYELDDPKLKSIFHGTQKIQDAIGRYPAIILFPTLAKMIPKLSGWNVVVELTETVGNILKIPINEHLETLPEDGVARDFLDDYIGEIKRTTDPNSSFYKEAGIQSLLATLADFLFAGSDTVTNTISWAVLYLSKFPEVQRKLQKELDAVVGRNRNPSLNDRPLLPYVDATIAETMRYSSIIPFALIHAVSEDTKILDYDCPKGTQIIPNLYYFHHNEKFFPNPKEFKPERFLSEDEKVFKKSEALMPFGYGKRQCLGEALARDEVFLFLTNIFHRFSVQLPDGCQGAASLEPQNGFVLAPKAYDVVLTERA